MDGEAIQNGHALMMELVENLDVEVVTILLLPMGGGHVKVPIQNMVIATNARREDITANIVV